MYYINHLYIIRGFNENFIYLLKGLTTVLILFQTESAIIVNKTLMIVNKLSAV